MPGPVFVLDMAGDEAPWFLVTAGLALSAAAAVEVFTARFRQEDAIRDHQQRLRREECRAWTKEPILRPFQVQLVALTVRRLLQARLGQAWGDRRWGLQPAWNRRQRYASLLDLRRRCWRYRPPCSPFLVDLDDLEKIPPALGRYHNPAEEVASIPGNHCLVKINRYTAGAGSKVTR
jgi:hypothetical protein